jgi:hypothetical protein
VGCLRDVHGSHCHYTFCHVQVGVFLMMCIVKAYYVNCLWGVFLIMCMVISFPNVDGFHDVYSLRHLQAALQPLKVPGVQAFLHLLPTVAALWVVVDVGPITVTSVQGSVVPALTYGLQVRQFTCFLGRGLNSKGNLFIAGPLREVGS